MSGEYVLYVAYDQSDATRSQFCPGSRRAIELTETVPEGVSVHVQSVDVLRQTGVPLPTFLVGTPTRVSRETRRAMRGTAAIDHLRQLIASSETQAAAPAPNVIDGLTSPHEEMHLGGAGNFEPLTRDDPEKYTNARKVTDEDVQRMLDRRKATIGKP